MASNNIDDEKPNLRPTKHTTANGKSLFLHHNPNQPSNKSYIHAIQKSNDQQDPFGIDQVHIEYSLNKQKRWEILDEFHENRSDSSSDNNLYTLSDSEQQQPRNKHRKKYRLFQYNNTQRQGNVIKNTNQSEEISKITDKNESVSKRHQDTDDGNDDRRDNDDTIYVAVVPPSRENELINIRKNHGTKDNKGTSSTHRYKFSGYDGESDNSDQIDDEQENLSSDEDQSMTTYYTYSKSNKLDLNDFIPTTPTNKKNKISSKTLNKTRTNNEDLSKSKIKYYRQISKEEKLYNRDMSTYIKQQQEIGQIMKPKEKTLHYLMPISYQTIYLYQPDFTKENLSKIFGKNFLHAQCYPTKYLICLTDRLKSLSWSNKPELFSLYSSLNCYLIIIFNNQENLSQGQIALNMDLYANTIQIDNLFQTNETIYKLDELINKVIEFITNISFDLFKPIDSELSKRRFLRNKIENDLSESELINKQIDQVQLLDKKDLQTKLTTDNLSIDNKSLIRPDICTNCCCDIDASVNMTALKSCKHWLCDQCWKQYLENSIKTIKIIRCPEWNCSSIVDIGTILSLVNVRCMNIYERNLEKCLVNLSRSHIKCPLKSCSNIIEIVDSTIDNVRCRCGHQFCIDCKQEPHFPATCSSYRTYIEEAQRNGDFTSDINVKYIVQGRNCISCNEFIEKNGGCNHMTCRCGAQFCWACTGYWKEHSTPDGFRCPKKVISIGKQIITKARNPSRRFYEYAIYHRHERTFQNQVKQYENAKRLMGTIPLDKKSPFDTTLIKAQIDQRQILLEHAYEMVKYINYLHRICEYLAVAADGYGDPPCQFFNSLNLLQTVLLNLIQIFEGDRGYQAIQQLNELHKKSEKIIERIRQIVLQRRKNSIGYVTS